MTARDDGAVTQALSSEEWDRYAIGRESVSAEIFRDLFLGRPASGFGVRIESAGAWIAEGGKDRHALAALCLYQQPFGFDAADVEAVLTCAKASQNTGTEPATFLRAERVVAKLRALLPPEPETTLQDALNRAAKEAAEGGGFHTPFRTSFGDGAEPEKPE